MNFISEDLLERRARNVLIRHHFRGRDYRTDQYLYDFVGSKLIKGGVQALTELANNTKRPSDLLERILGTGHGSHCGKASGLPLADVMLYDKHSTPILRS